MDTNVERVGPIPDAVDRLLRSLPGWFGIEDAILDYVKDAGTLPTYAVSVGDEVVGVLLVKDHNPFTSEIHLMAVEPSLHRRGIGTALVSALETELIAAGKEFVLVKTLGPSRPDSCYEQTRRFYEAMGYRPLEELHGLWPENPCLLMVKHLESR